MKKIMKLCVLGVITMQLTACSDPDAGVITIPDRPVVTMQDETNTEEIAEEQVVAYRRMEGSDFLPFFKKYFSFTEQDLARLNQVVTSVDTDYWEFRNFYEEKLVERLGEYLSEEAKTQLAQEYVNKIIELPRKLEINEYVTYSMPQKVESAEVVSIRDSGNNKIYEVEVIAEYEVEDIVAANERYVWDNSRMYYTLKSEAKEGIPAFDSMKTEFENMLNSYLFLQDRAENNKDVIKLAQRYWIEVAPHDTLQITSIREANGIVFQPETKQKANNVKHVTRLAYYEEPSQEEVRIVQEVFGELMSKSKDFYKYLEEAYHTGFEAYQKALTTEYQATKYLNLREQDYTQAFNYHISPYKDSTQVIKVKSENIKLQSSKSSTKFQPRYKVLIGVETVESDFSTKYYEYEYFVGFEKDKIEVIQFVGRREMTKEWYEAP